MMYYVSTEHQTTQQINLSFCSVPVPLSFSVIDFKSYSRFYHHHQSNLLSVSLTDRLPIETLNIKIFKHFETAQL